jgi:TolB-like protein/Tfp pilus assembly protein PilF
MQGLAPSDIFLFEDFRLGRQGGLSRRGDNDAFVPVAIGSRALDILGVLIGRAGEIVPKEDILAAVWPETVVEDNNLTVQISTLRRVLDRGRANGSCILTVPGRGYRFVASVTRAEANAHAAASAQAGVRAAPRLSIVVLPFVNLSKDPDQQHFADGITDNLTTDLSRLAGMLVISRNTAFMYRSRFIDTKQIGRELGVRYLLEGSVQRSASQVRINAQLVNAENDMHLWAERCDCDTSDLFALQDEITSRIAIALNAELVSAEAARPTGRPDALDYIFRARAAGLKPPSRDVAAEVISLLERALALDPQSAEAQSSLAGALAGRVFANMTDTAVADLERARRLSEQALAASPRSPIAHFAKGQLLRAQGRYTEAIPEFETVLAANHNAVYAIFALGQCKLRAGSIEETIPLVERALRLSPRDPQLGAWYSQIGQVHLPQSRIDEAILWLEKARSANPKNPGSREDRRRLRPERRD